MINFLQSIMCDVFIMNRDDIAKMEGRAVRWMSAVADTMIFMMMIMNNELESVILEIVVVSEPTTTSGKYLFM